MKLLPHEKSKTIAKFFQVLADPTRVRIVNVLAHGKYCVSDLVLALKMDQPAVSHQLKYLRKNGYVAWEKQGRHIFYSLNHALLKELLGLALDNFEIHFTKSDDV